MAALLVQFPVSRLPYPVSRTQSQIGNPNWTVSHNPCLGNTDVGWILLSRWWKIERRVREGDEGRLH